MFDSLSGGYIPVLVLALVTAWVLVKVRPVWLRFLLAFLLPIAISLGWYFLPRLPSLFPPRDPDAWIEWGFAAALVWSIFSVPLCVLATLALTLFQHFRGRRHAS